MNAMRLLSTRRPQWALRPWARTPGLLLALGLGGLAACSGGPGPDPRCGDGVADPGEPCDGSDLAGTTCESEGFYAGNARCTAACRLDTTGCQGRCGDGRVQSDAGEACDGFDLRSLSCVALGYNGGDLACDPTCQLELSGCEAFGRCGDGVRDVAGGEECDDTDLGGLTCALPWEPAATFECTASCRRDPEGCTAGRTLGTATDARTIALVKDDDGNLYVGGYTDGTLPGETSAGGWDCLLAKLDPAGNVIWARQWGAAGDDEVDGIALDPSGNVWVASSTSGPVAGEPYAGGTWDIQIRRFTPDGTPTLTRQWGTPEADWPMALASTPQGDLYVTGSTRGILGNSSAGDYDLFVAQIAADGTPLWLEQWGTSQQDRGNDLALAPDGELFIAGVTYGSFDGNTNAGYCDALLLKVGPQGALRWSRQIGDFGNEHGMAVAVTPTGEPLLAGWTEGQLDADPSLGSMDFFLTKFTADGEQLWLRQGGSTKWDGAWGVAVDGGGAAYLLAVTAGHAYGWVNGGGDSAWGSCDDLLLVKYDSQGSFEWARQWGTAAPEHPSLIVMDGADRLLLGGSIGRGDSCESWTGDAQAFVIQTSTLP